MPRVGRYFGSEGRYANAGGVRGFISATAVPAAWAAGGLTASRIAGELWSKLLTPTLAKSPSLTPYTRLANSLAGAASVWGANKWLVKRSVDSRHKGLLNLGAGLLVVQEALNLVLPMLGLGNNIVRRALTGESPLGGGCFTGSCHEALAPYGYRPCAYDEQGQPIPGSEQPVPLQGQQGQAGLDGGCFSGSCYEALNIGNGNCAGTGPCCNCGPTEQPPMTTFEPTAPAPTGNGTEPSGATVNPVSGYGLAGDTAIRQGNVQDPVVQQILAGACAKAQSILDQVGIQ